jgi:hypothetical protein
MAALGILTLDSKEYKVLEFNYKSNQPTDKLGRPVGRSKGCHIDLILESDKSTSILSWMLGYEEKDGVIAFYKHDAMSKFKEFAFKKAHCVSWVEKFEANGNLPMRQILTIFEPYREKTDEVVAPPKKIVQQEKKETKVKTIKLITALDDGSANDNTGTGIQKGMVFGKTYEFKVTDYTEETPENKSTINWMVKYHDLSKNKWVDNKLSHVGETLKFTVNEKEMCGRFIYVRAYIKDAETEGELKVWKHNRFRWFDRLIVESEIKERTINNQPWKVNQSGTSLCGMACIFYLFAKEQPENYKKFAKELFRTGEAHFNNYTVKPSIEVLEKKPFVDGTLNDEEYPWHWILIKNKRKKINMPLIDYITMAGTRNTDNPSYKGGKEELQAINWPPLMTSLSENLLGYKEVESKGIYNPIAPIGYTSKDIENKIGDINKQIKNGYKLILMIDSDLIDDLWDKSSFDLHWVILDSEIREVKMLDSNGQVMHQLDFSVYTWGTNPFDTARYLKRPISKNHFMNNYNGYVKIK